MPGARRAYRLRDTGTEIDAHIIGLTWTRLLFLSILRWLVVRWRYDQTRGVSIREQAILETEARGDDIRCSLEAARKSRRHQTPKLAGRHHRDRDVLASKAERRDQPSGLRRDTVWPRRVTQKDSPGPKRSTPCIMTDFNDQMGVSRNDDEKSRDRRLPSRKKGALPPHCSRTFCRKKTPFREERPFASTGGTLTRRSRRNASAAEPMSSLGQNWSLTAIDKKHTKTTLR